MFLTEKISIRNLLLPATLLAIFVSLASLTGCGLRQSQTGSLHSRVVDASGNAVVNAEVFSIFAEREKVFSGLDGGFYLSELPAGINNIVILHQDFAIEERQIEIKSGESTVLDFIRLDKANAPDRISDVKVVKTASTSAEISWNTYKSVICNVEYGMTISYGCLIREQRASNEHHLVIDNLQPETLYHFRVQYLDENDASYYSYDYSFKTGNADMPSTPASLKIRPFTTLGTVEVEWQSAISGFPAAGYNLYRQIKGGDWLKINETSIDARTFTYSDRAVPTGSFCRYAIRAVNNLGAESDATVSEMVFVPGVISQTTTLTIADSPIRLYSDLIVAAGASLVIEAGTEILVSETDSLAAGSDEQRVEITVQGRIEISGTAESPVVFAPLNGSGRRDHWAGIRILSSQTGISDISYVRLFGCSGYALDVSALNMRISNLEISYSQHGLRLDGIREVMNLSSCSFNEIASIALELKNCRRMTVENGLFSEVHTGIVTSTDKNEDQVIIKDCDIYADAVGIKGVWGRNRVIRTLVVSPEGTGIICDNILHSYDNYIDHVTIDARNGILVRAGNVTIQNNIVVDRFQNGSVGIENLTLLTPGYGFNNVYGFSENYRGCSGSTGALSIDPKFAAGNPYDYRLLSESTLKLQDIYGSEMGRYGVSRL